MKKLLPVVMMIGMAGSAQAYENAADLRDSLSTIYNNLGGANTWVNTDYGTTHAALAGVYQAADSVTASGASIGYDPETGFSFTANPSGSLASVTTAVEGLVTEVTSDILGGTAVDHTGTASGTRLITASSEGTLTASSGGLIDNKLQLALDAVNPIFEDVVEGNEVTALEILDANTLFTSRITHVNEAVAGLYELGEFEVTSSNLDSLQLDAEIVSTRNEITVGTDLYCSYTDYVTNTIEADGDCTN